MNPHSTYEVQASRSRSKCLRIMNRHSASSATAAVASPAQCFCSKPLPSSHSSKARTQDDDDASIYCSRQCARDDAMRALELRSVPSSTHTHLSTASSTGSDTFYSDIFSASTSFASPLSVISISSSAASAGAHSDDNSSSASATGESRRSHRNGLIAQGSHYRLMAAAAEAAESQAEVAAVDQNVTQARGLQQHDAWTSAIDARPVSSVTVQDAHAGLLPPTPASTASHTPRLASRVAARATSAKAVHQIVSADSQIQASFMDNVLAQLRLSASPPLDAASPTFSQLLPAFGAADEEDEEEEELSLREKESVPPPPGHPRLSNLSQIATASSALEAKKSAAAMQVTMSTESDKTLVEPCANISGTAPNKAIFSPASTGSHSTTGHWSRPSDASTMTVASSASSFSSVSSTRSLVQARQLRKEIDSELRQMAYDLAELRRREHEAMVYGISRDRRLVGGHSMDLSEDLDASISDVFEYDDGHLDEGDSSELAAALLATNKASTVGRHTRRQSGYRWSRADKELIARCISTCFSISEDVKDADEKRSEEPKKQPVRTSASCTRVWDGVQLRNQDNDPNPTASGIEVDLAFFLESEEDEEDELLRPTYEMPLGFLNQPLERSPDRYELSTSTVPPRTPASNQASVLHHSRSTPHLSPSLASPTRAALETYLNADRHLALTATPTAQFEIMAATPIQLPPRTAPCPKEAASPPRLRQVKSRNGLLGLRAEPSSPGSTASKSASIRTSGGPAGTARSLRSVASSGLLRVGAGMGLSRGCDERETLARGPSGGATTPTTPSQLKATLTAAFNRTPSRTSNHHTLSPGGGRPLPPTPLDGSPPASCPTYNYGQGIAYAPYGFAGAINKRLPVTPAGVARGPSGLTKAKALDRLQGLLGRRILASSQGAR